MKLKKTLKILGLMLIFMLALNVNVYADELITEVNLTATGTIDNMTFQVADSDSDKYEIDTINSRLDLFEDENFTIEKNNKSKVAYRKIVLKAKSGYEFNKIDYDTRQIKPEVKINGDKDSNIYESRANQDNNFVITFKYIKGQIHFTLNNFKDGKTLGETTITNLYYEYDKINYPSTKTYMANIDYKIFNNTLENPMYLDNDIAIIGNLLYYIELDLKREDFPNMPITPFNNMIKINPYYVAINEKLEQDSQKATIITQDTEGKITMLAPRNTLSAGDLTIEYETFEDINDWDGNVYTYKDTAILPICGMSDPSKNLVFTGYKDDNNELITSNYVEIPYNKSYVNVHPQFAPYRIIDYPSSLNNYGLIDNVHELAGALRDVTYDLYEVEKSEVLSPSSYPLRVIPGDKIIFNNGKLETENTLTLKAEISNIDHSTDELIDDFNYLKQGDKIILNITTEDDIASLKIKENGNTESYGGKTERSFQILYSVKHNFSKDEKLEIEIAGEDDISCEVKILRYNGDNNYEATRHVELGNVINGIDNMRYVTIPNLEPNKYYYFKIKNTYKGLDGNKINETLPTYTNVFNTKTLSSSSKTKKYSAKEVNIAVDASSKDAEKKEEAVISGSGRKGSTVTISLPENRRVLEVLVTDKKGNNIELNKEDDGTLTFIQPASNVNIDIKYINKEITLNLNNTEVDIDGEKKYIDVMPQIKNDRTMVPLRFVMETLGLGVEWLPEDPDIVRIENADGTTTIMNLKTGKTFLEGKEVELDAKPYVDKDRTMVPIRFISESAGAVVNWDEKKPNEVKIYEVE